DSATAASPVAAGAHSSPLRATSRASPANQDRSSRTGNPSTRPRPMPTGPPRVPSAGEEPDRRPAGPLWGSPDPSRPRAGSLLEQPQPPGPRGGVGLDRGLLGLGADVERLQALDHDRDPRG